MSRRSKMKTHSITVLTAVALIAPAFADSGLAAAHEPLAGVSVEVGAVSFRPLTAEAMTLKVAGRGFRSSQLFASGQTPSFAPVDRKGFALPDGLYKWELVENPQLPAARATGAGKPANGRATHQMPAPEGRRQSGSFAIRNGKVVDPSLLEPVARSASAAQLPEALRSEAAHYHDADTPQDR
ncbi:MAG: hypothetical protein ACE5GX_18385 [Thermoanaerobaculia bacterium]